MNKIAVVFAVFVLAAGYVVATCLADDMQDNTGPRIKVTKIEHKDTIDYIEFLDDFGNTKKKIKMKYRTSEEWQAPEYTEVTALLSANEKFVAVTETHSKKNTEKEIYNTGHPRTNKRTITLYDEEGNEIFKKRGVSYFPLVISNNGERVVCYKPGLDIEEYAHYDDANENMKHYLYVFDKKGTQLFNAKEGQIYHTFVKISPSGTWLAYKTLNKAGEKTNLINIDTGERLELSGDIKYNHVTDEGDLVGLITHSVQLPNGEWKIDEEKTKVIIEYSRKRGGHE